MILTGEDVNTYRSVALEYALRLYYKTGMKVNSAYTPRRMMKAAAQITGKTFKARDYLGAANALKEARNG